MPHIEDGGVLDNDSAQPDQKAQKVAKRNIPSQLVLRFSGGELLELSFNPRED